jgi:Polyketide cyclase / dehydrase and lipid transport
MLTNIILALLVLLVALLAFVATRPGEFRIVRSRTVAAAPDLVHTFVNDFHKWPAWSPWEKLDPLLKREFSGPASGTGAAYHWSGSKKVGEGRMTITDSRVPNSVTIRLEFIKPWTTTNTTQFDFAPRGSGTEVTWPMSGHNNLMAKVFSLFMSMEKMVGPDFEKGLAGLDAATTTPTATPGGAA